MTVAGTLAQIGLTPGAAGGVEVVFGRLTGLSGLGFSRPRDRRRRIESGGVGVSTDLGTRAQRTAFNCDDTAITHTLLWMRSGGRFRANVWPDGREHLVRQV